LKRKALGDSVFDLMSKPKIETKKVKLNFSESGKKLTTPKISTQKGEGKAPIIHVFKK